MSMTPSKVRFGLRVGGIGHRPNRLPANQNDIIENTVAMLLIRVREVTGEFQRTHADLFTPEPALLRAVTSLAEGGDRLFARAAIAHGYALSCVLPFSQARFEQDFNAENSLHADAGSVAEFRALLQAAAEGPGLTLFELDGELQPESRQYQAASRTVLNQADLLFVVWDGDRETRPGGTYETINEALRANVPVVWIDPQNSATWRLLRQESELIEWPAPGDQAALTATIVQLVAPPADSKPVHEYFRDAPSASRLGGWPRLWSYFRRAFGGRFATTDPAPPRAVADQREAALPAAVSEWLDKNLTGHYAAADRLAQIYGDRYRSSFLLSYGLSVLAVLLALVPVGFGWNLEYGRAGIIVCAVLELVTVSVICWLVWWGNRQRWHDRWMAYRLTAELLRQQRLLLPLGLWRSAVSSPAHLQAYGMAESTWMYWHVRSIARAAGLPKVRMDVAYLRDCMNELCGVIRDQMHFHHSSAARDKRIEHRFHKGGLGLFVITILVIAAHLVHALADSGSARPGQGTHHGHWLAALCALLPALGAAFAAISNQGEFARVAKRSKAMAERFGEMLKQISAWEQASTPPNSTSLLRMSHQVSQMMVAEVLDWRVVFLDRPLVMPA